MLIDCRLQATCNRFQRVIRLDRVAECFRAVQGDRPLIPFIHRTGEPQRGLLLDLLDQRAGNRDIGPCRKHDRLAGFVLHNPLDCPAAGCQPEVNG